MFRDGHKIERGIQGPAVWVSPGSLQQIPNSVFAYQNVLVNFPGDSGNTQLGNLIIVLVVLVFVQVCIVCWAYECIFLSIPMAITYEAIVLILVLTEAASQKQQAIASHCYLFSLFFFGVSIMFRKMLFITFSGLT